MNNREIDKLEKLAKAGTITAYNPEFQGNHDYGGIINISENVLKLIAIARAAGKIEKNKGIDV